MAQKMEIFTNDSTQKWCAIPKDRPDLVKNL